MKPNILFICLGNSCRSIMAEALARCYHGGLVHPYSAGLSPLGYIVPETKAVLLELGIMTIDLYSKGLAEVPLPAFTAIVNLTRHDLTRQLPPTLKDRVIDRYVHDPYGGTLDTYRRVRDDIRRLLAHDLESWLIHREGKSEPERPGRGGIFRKKG